MMNHDTPVLSKYLMTSDFCQTNINLSLIITCAMYGHGGCYIIHLREYRNQNIFM